MSHSVADFHYLCQFCNQDVSFVKTQTSSHYATFTSLHEYSCLRCETWYYFANERITPYLIIMLVEKDGKEYSMNWFVELPCFSLFSKDDLIVRLIVRLDYLPTNITPANKLEKLQTFWCTHE